MEYYLALAMFAFATSITPGPNNLMLLASGLNHGIKRSLPHFLGVSIGFCSLIILVGLGLGTVLLASPTAFAVIKIFGVSYLLLLAWKIAHAGDVRVIEGARNPLSFFQAAVFQYVNPKAWTMAVGAVATFSNHESTATTLLVITIAFFAVGVISQGAWLVAGQSLHRFLTEGRWQNFFNITMSILLVLSIIPMTL